MGGYYPCENAGLTLLTNLKRPNTRKMLASTQYKNVNSLALGTYRSLSPLTSAGFCFAELALIELAVGGVCPLSDTTTLVLSHDNRYFCTNPWTSVDGCVLKVDSRSAESASPLDRQSLYQTLVPVVSNRILGESRFM